MSHSQSNINLKVIRTYDKNNCNKVKLKIIKHLYGALYTVFIVLKLI